MDFERLLRHGKNLVIYKAIVQTPEDCQCKVHQHQRQRPCCNRGRTWGRGSRQGVCRRRNYMLSPSFLLSFLVSFFCSQLPRSLQPRSLAVGKEDKDARGKYASRGGNGLAVAVVFTRPTSVPFHAQLPGSPQPRSLVVSGRNTWTLGEEMFLGVEMGQPLPYPSFVFMFTVL